MNNKIGVTYKKVVGQSNNCLEVMWTVLNNGNTQELSPFVTLLLDPRYQETSSQYLLYCDYWKRTNWTVFQGEEQLGQDYLNIALCFKEIFDEKKKTEGLFLLSMDDAKKKIEEQRRPQDVPKVLKYKK